MDTHRRTVRYFLLLAVIGLSALTNLTEAASEKGWFGLGVSVEVEGFSFNPTLEAIKITKVMPASPAAAAGLIAGDLIVEIQGMAIPGAKAKEVKAAMNQTVGASLRLKIKRGGADPRPFTLVAVAKP